MDRRIKALGKYMKQCGTRQSWVVEGWWDRVKHNGERRREREEKEKSFSGD